MTYDLLISDGEVIDPGSRHRGRMDVGIGGGKIVEVAASLRSEDARKTISAQGRLVTPGLVAVHAHVFANCSDMRENTDRLCKSSGVTTMCDAVAQRFTKARARVRTARSRTNLSPAKFAEPALITHLTLKDGRVLYERPAE
jgi:predicted amidohydrolase